MATEFLIRVKVDPGDAVKAADGVGDALDKAKGKAEDLGSVLKQAFGLYFIEQSIEEIAKLADGYTALQNRLRTVATDQANLNGLSEATYKIAQETRTSWEEVASMYSRVARNAANLGYSQQDLLKFQVALNQAVKIGGATSMEASAGLVQLSQGLASGTLRGDELRSVLEQLPVVADTIAKHLGVTRGELRTLGKEGKLTGRAVIDAFLEASDSLGNEFGKTVPTLAEDVVMLKNAFQDFLGRSDVAKGIMLDLGGAIRFVIQHMDAIAKILMTVATIMGVYFAQQAIGKMIDGLKRLGVAAVENPMGALLYVVVALIAAMRQFGDDIDLQISGVVKMNGVTTTLGDALKAIWIMFKEIGDQIEELLGGAWKALQEAFGSDGIDHEKVSSGLGQVVDMFMAFVFTIVEMFKNMKTVLTVTFVDIPIELANAFVAAYPAIKEVLEKIINGVFHAVNGLKDLINGPRVGAFEKTIDDVSAAQRDELAKNLQDKSPAGIAHAQAVQAQYSKVITNLRSEVDRMQGKAIPFDLEIDTKKLSGMARAARDERENLIRTIGSGVDKDMDHFHDTIAQIAAARKQSEGTIGTDAGKQGKPAVDEAALKRLRAELDAIRSASNPITAALVKIEHATRVLNAALSAGLIDGRQYMQILMDTTNKLKEELNPYGTMIGKLRAAKDATYDLMSGKREQSEVEKELAKITQEQADKGAILTDEQKLEVQGLLEVTAWYRELIRAKQEISEEDKKYQAEMRKYQDDMKKFANRTDVGVDAVVDGFKKIRTEAYNVGKDMREMFVSLYKSVSDSIVSFVETGHFAWKGLVTNMLEDIERILLKLTTIQIIKGLGLDEDAPIKPIQATSAAQVEVAGQQVASLWATTIVTAAQTGAAAFAAAIGGGGAVAGATASSSSIITDILAAGGATGAASGASGGSIIGDTLTEGGVVLDIGKVNRRGPQRRSGQTIGSQDPRSAAGAIDTSEGEKVVANFTRRNAGYIRGITGTRRY